MAFSTSNSLICPSSSSGEEETLAQLPNLPTCACASMIFLELETFLLYSGGISEWTSLRSTPRDLWYLNEMA